MKEVIIIGLDLAKNVFQAHGMRSDGGVAFRTKLPRTKAVEFFASLDLSRFRAAPSARLGHFPFEGDRAFPAQC